MLQAAQQLPGSGVGTGRGHSAQAQWGEPICSRSLSSPPPAATVLPPPDPQNQKTNTQVRRLRWPTGLVPVAMSAWPCAPCCRVSHILNMAREIDNFYPERFTYHNVRLWDEESAQLLPHWKETHRFVEAARSGRPTPPPTPSQLPAVQGPCPPPACSALSFSGPQGP